MLTTSHFPNKVLYLAASKSVLPSSVDQDRGKVALSGRMKFEPKIIVFEPPLDWVNIQVVPFPSTPLVQFIVILWVTETVNISAKEVSVETVGVEVVRAATTGVLAVIAVEAEEEAMAAITAGETSLEPSMYTPFLGGFSFPVKRDKNGIF